MSGSGLPPALLFGGDQMAVSAARSLAALGVEVHAVGDREDPVRASRACSSYTTIERRLDTGERYLDFLERGPRGAVVLPCDDESLEVLARHRQLVLSWGYLPVEADDDVMLAMLDKERTYELSRAAGIPTPRTLTLRSIDDAHEAGRSFSYPCALKPLAAHRFFQVTGDVSGKVILAHDPDELAHGYEVSRAMGVEMLVTEIIPGDDDAFCSYYTYMLPDGSPLFDLTKHKLRQLPIGFGLTCYQETVWEPEVAALGLRFCQAIGLRGVANIEFKHDPRDGEWKIIECNHRFTLANEIVRLAGIDIPVMAYRRAAGLFVPPVADYRLGVRMWSPIEDVKAFRQYRAAGKITTWEWVRSLLCRWHFPMLRLDDPMPTVRRMALTRGPNLVRAMIRVLGRRAQRPPAPAPSLP